METLKYKVITSITQYNRYCRILHDLDFSKQRKTKSIEEEISLLIVLIEKWDAEHRDFKKLDPIEILRSLMTDHQMKSKDLAELLDINKSYVSDILNYKKGLSKEVIRKLAERFKVSQETFNRPYSIKTEANRGHKDEKMMNPTKKVSLAYYK
jgi:HTH-type transcriptional regulator/antitoxin HigA